MANVKGLGSRVRSTLMNKVMFWLFSLNPGTKTTRRNRPPDGSRVKVRRSGLWMAKGSKILPLHVQPRGLKIFTRRVTGPRDAKVAKT